MKLLICSPYYLPHAGGTEYYVDAIARGLVEKYNWDVSIITSSVDSNPYSEETINGIHLYRLPFQFKLSNTPINFNWYSKIDELTLKIKPDIIDAQFPVPFMADIALRIAKKNRIPYVLTYHNDLVKENSLLQFAGKVYYALAGNFLLDHSDTIVVTSQYYALHSPYLKRLASKIDVISPGIYIPQDHSGEANLLKTQFEGKTLVLFVGQLDKTHQHKGLQNLIKSMVLSQTDHPELLLLVVGSGDNEKYFKTLVSDQGLERNVHFTGHVSNVELEKLYEASDMLVLPSLTSAEGFGMVLIEAAAHKKAVIGSNIGGIPFAIEKGKTGLLVEPGDILGLSKSISQLARDSKLRLELGMNGYERVMSQFLWEKQVEKTHNLLASLL